ncbi:Ig-like domain-containing protein [Bradyrhizobium sp. 188]|uniref:Ig-like domain-containing protein n=1 Tax=Bradyrhizobium sp. 188 TaxID=2782656 RepID=UPI001FFB4C4E|nr:Ig-like domain-containing protein [Bradyrhizobium sp. 188]MCK1498282.1 cadherin-like domain-containing protein [Bradyrhizobium sp. 188]
MSINYTLTISDPNNSLGANSSLVAKDIDYVMSYLGQYIVFQAPLDLQIVVKPSSENPFNTDGLLPSIPAWVTFNGQETLAAMVKGQTGIDPNEGLPDGGFTIYLGNDGTIRNYGDPVWFDPNPQLGIVPDIPNGSDDFISIATHEIIHCLGFATWPEVNAPWNQHTVQQNGVWYYSSPTVDHILGGKLPLDPNEIPGKAGDHIGNTSIAYQPITSDLMYEWGNYQNNRFDIGQLDLSVLQDLGWTIQHYQTLPLVDPLDNYNHLGTKENDTIFPTKFSSTIAACAGDDTVILPFGSGNGNYVIDGGPGADTVVLPAPSTQFNVVSYQGDFLLQSKDGSDGVSLLHDVECIQFSDQIISLQSPVVAVADEIGVAKGSTLSVAAAAGVLANDTDPDIHDYLVVSAVNGSAEGVGHAVKGAYGSLTLNADGSYIYAANKGALPSHIVAQETFNFVVSDGQGESDTSTLSVVVFNPGVIYQSGTNTTLIGAADSKNVLDGSAGHDVLIGGSAPDVLIGGNGDTLTGGPGPDTFLFRPNFGTNVVTDFNINNESLQFEKSIFASVSDLLNHSAVGSAGVIINDGHGDTITLTGVTLSEMQAHHNNFHLV